MAKTPCVAQHNYVCCKPCLLKWFEQKLTCPLCSTPAPVKSCLRKTEWRARLELRHARRRAKEQARADAVAADEAAARDLVRHDEMQMMDRMEQVYLQFL